MKINILKIFLLLFVLSFITACEQESVDPGATPLVDVAGEWWVEYYYEDPPGSGTFINPGWGIYKIITSNTASNTVDEMLIDDTEGWGVMYKVNVSGTSFSVTDAEDLAGGTDAITVSNGTVIIDGGLSTSGVVTDSISFDFVQPTADPTLYRAAGVRRTGFLEDEH